MLLLGRFHPTYWGSDPFSDFFCSNQGTIEVKCGSFYRYCMIIIDSNLWAMQFLKFVDLIRIKHMLLNQSYFIIVKMRDMYVSIVKEMSLQERVST